MKAVTAMATGAAGILMALAVISMVGTGCSTAPLIGRNERWKRRSEKGPELAV
jgi:hypothetical protein